MDKLTIIIQGPLSHYLYRKLHKYKKYGQILISTWDYVETNFLPDYVNLVSTPLPNKSKAVGTISNFYYAVCGMDNAMQNINSKYVVRTRGDEYFENLDFLIQTFQKNRSKVVCGNIFSKKWDDRPLHIGDHIYIGESKTFREAFSLLRNMYDQKKELESWAIQGGEDVDPFFGITRSSEAEVILAKAILKVKKSPKELWYDKKNFLKYFEIFDINSTRPFIASWQNGNKKYINKFKNPYGVSTTSDL